MSTISIGDRTNVCTYLRPSRTQAELRQREDVFVVAEESTNRVVEVDKTVSCYIRYGHLANHAVCGGGMPNQ